jgi:GNAT superfamily N-acetyltransferase
MLQVRPLTRDDRPWADRVEADSWGQPVVVRLGELIDPTRLPGFVALLDGQPAGLGSHALRDDECEIVTLRSLHEGRGVGRALLDAIRQVAVEAGCRRSGSSRRTPTCANAIYHDDGDDALTRSEFVAPLVRLLRDGALDGSLRTFPDPDEAATVLYTQVSYTYLHLRHEHRWPAERATRAVTELAPQGVTGSLTT